MLLMKTFPGGVHPPDNKEWTAHKAIEDCAIPDEIVIPFLQHVGAPAEPCVAKGERVRKGQVVGRARGYISVPVHASTSGEVVAVEPRQHPSGRSLPAVVIRPDGEDLWAEEVTPADPEMLGFDAIVERIRAAGIIGMGGGAFPTHVKLSPPPEKPIDTLIINGVECEPYLTSDHRLMLEGPERILDGMRTMTKVLGATRLMIGIEANKPDAIEALRRISAGSIEIVPLKVKYPQGAERQLIYSLTGRAIPNGVLPMEAGVIVQNVATAAAVSDAVRRGVPLIERIVTVTGPAVAEPKNLRVRVGTPYSHLVERCGGLTGDPAKIIMGGPMMGTAQLSLDVPITRGASGILLFTEGDIPLVKEGPCIRCGRCMRVCPARIVPTTVAAYARLDMFEEAERFNAAACIECGCCTYACPAAIPLVQAIRQAKGAIAARKREL